MNRMIFMFRSRMDTAVTRKAVRHLDNHLLRDIGMPERDPRATFGKF